MTSKKQEVSNLLEFSLSLQKCHYQAKCVFVCYFTKRGKSWMIDYVIKEFFFTAVSAALFFFSVRNLIFEISPPQYVKGDQKVFRLELAMKIFVMSLITL